MILKYWLFVVFAGQMQVVGPFDGLIACEKAASQIRIAMIESNNGWPVKFATVCLNQKHTEFKFAEPKK